MYTRDLVMRHPALNGEEKLCNSEVALHIKNRATFMPVKQDVKKRIFKELKDI